MQVVGDDGYVTGAGGKSGEGTSNEFDFFARLRKIHWTPFPVIPYRFRNSQDTETPSFLKTVQQAVWMNVLI